ncbi:MAG: TolC family outer membrane protein [Rhodospirillaceae bacterium]|nr:TolC family outer membrane protein [Rhodospirillaceae bacterium]MBT6204808.1 TolC family outer membrane protein [Rhodospirillaceae bacterium]MBT7615161.1 TolC family outer membrane protein [Rhodospirillaceae bacterium]
MNLNSSFRVFLSAAAVGALLSAPISARAQSLEEALVLAYDNNPTLAAARAELRSVDEQISQALSGWRPTISAQGTLALERSETNTTPYETTHPNNYSLNLTQPLYRGGRTVASTSQADNVIIAQRARLATTEQQVLLDTVVAYMDVVLARSVVDLAISNEQRLLRQLEATEDRFRVGEVTRTDVSQARARFANSQAERVQAEGDLIAQAANFEEIIGVKPTSLSRPGTFIGLPGTLDEAMAISGSENPALLQAIATELAAQDGIDVQIGDLLPEVNLIASYSRLEDLSTLITQQDQASIQAQLTIPLYQAGLASSEVRSAQQTAAQRRLQVDVIRRQVEANVVNAWQALATSLAESTAFATEVEANEVALEGTEREAQVGERTVLDILDAEQALFQSQISLTTAERDAVVASYALQAAMGRLTAGSLRLPVVIYDVEEYYDEARGAWWGYGGLTDD